MSVCIVHAACFMAEPKKKMYKECERRKEVERERRRAAKKQRERGASVGAILGESVGARRTFDNSPCKGSAFVFPRSVA